MYMGHTVDMNSFPGFANRLKELIEDKSREMGKKPNQKELAIVFCCEQSFVSQMITGKKLPSTETAINICNYFECCVDWLLRGVGPKKLGQNMNIYDLIDQSQLNESQKFAVKALLHSFTPQNKN